MALIMEAIMVVIFEAIGLSLTRSGRQARQDMRAATEFPEGHPRQTLRSSNGTPAAGQDEVPKAYAGQGQQQAMPAVSGGGRRQQRRQQQQQSGILGTLGRRTIIGRIITSAMNSGGEERDIEMQRRY